MSAIRETVVAGNLIFTKITMRTKRVPGQKREKRNRPTIEAVEKINQKNAVKDLAIKLNYNFNHGDLHIVLTYSGNPPTPKEAEEHLTKMKRKMRTECKKAGVALKWIGATEYENTRIHHHLVCNYTDVKKIAELWSHGKVFIRTLEKNGDYRKLAEYLIKETSKTFRKRDSGRKRRFTCSRTIITPDAKQEEISAANLIKDPKPTKGYYIDPDSIYKGMNPFTGRPYLEYVQISLTEKPRLNSWRKGKKRKLHIENYDKWISKNRAYQVSLEELIGYKDDLANNKPEEKHKQPEERRI